MIHHTDLLRTNSDGEQQGFSAPIGNYLNEVDCGISALPCLTKCLKLEKCAKFGVFVAVLSLVGFFHGVTITYFRGTSNIWSTHYNISQDTVDWLIYTNEVFVGLSALAVAYWGNRIHRASWIGSLTIFLAIASATLAVPEIYNPLNGTEIDDSISGSLCNANNTRSQSYIRSLQKEFDMITVAVIIIFQILFATATVSFIAHGMTYIDDHISPKHSPGFIGLTLAANEVGKQAGVYCSWAPYVINVDSIFISPVWIVVCVLTFMMGIVMAMFPKVLPNVVMLKSVNSLLSLASGNNALEEEEAPDGFFKSLWRILKNKILMINILSLVMIQSAVINFGILEKDFNQAKYHLSKHNDNSGYSDPFLIQFTTNLLRQPMVAVSVLTAGMMIAKMRPKAKYLIIWNSAIFKVVSILFASTAFWTCASRIENEHSHTITIPYCSSGCGCNLDGSFQPVCVDRRTFFSPCLAGCTNFSIEHNMYEDCSCGRIVTDGSCDSENCKIVLALSLANSIITSGLLASTLVTSLIINIRSVSNKDKAIALGLEFTFLGIIPYVPIRAIYYSISETFCEIDGKKGCQFYSDDFPFFVAITTLVLMILASIVATVLVFLVRDLELYKSRHFSSTSDIQLNETRDNRNNNSSNNNSGNDNSGVADHDTVDAIVESTDEDAGQRFLRRDKQMSEGRIKIPRPRSKEDRINKYLSEGELVPPLKNIKRGDTSTSKTSANSGLSTESLKAIANVVGDDHDSDTFSESESSRMNIRHTLPRKANIVETEF